jgi:hypothetical protein
VHGLCPPSALESLKLGPAWWAVRTAAGVDPNAFRVWIYEGPEAIALGPRAGTTATSRQAATLLT